MAISSCSVKVTARAALKGKYVKAIAVSATAFFCSFACMIVNSLISDIASLKVINVAVFMLQLVFLQLPLYLGVTRTFWRMFMGQELAPLSVFHYFSCWKNYDRALKTIIQLVGRLFINSLLFLLPIGAINILSKPMIYERFGFGMPSFASNFWVLSDFLKVVGVFIVALIMIRYYMVPFLMVADEDMDIDEAINMSKIISKSTASDFVMLILSFGLYIIASLFALPLIFTVPYFVMAYLVHCRFAVSRYNKFANTDEDTCTFDANY